MSVTRLELNPGFDIDRVAAAAGDDPDVLRLENLDTAATPMRGWGGEVADRHVCFVFSNEPVERLALLGERVRAALA